jgi:hypothetical protein
VVVGYPVELECPACGETTTTLPPCASCGDALFGLSDRDELCEEDQVLYDTVKTCLCSCCDKVFCPVRTPESPPQTCQSIAQAFGCLREVCAEDIRICAER